MCRQCSMRKQVRSQMNRATLISCLSTAGPQRENRHSDLTAFPGCFNSLWAILAVVSSQGMLVPVCLLWEVNSSHEWGPWGWSSWAQEPMVSVLSCLLRRCLTLQKGDCVLASGR